MDFRILPAGRSEGARDDTRQRIEEISPGLDGARCWRRFNGIVSSHHLALIYSQFTQEFQMTVPPVYTSVSRDVIYAGAQSLNFEALQRHFYMLGLQVCR